ncbi:unnamed protein product [Protopolystoma xenopodis]|uniref:DNA topoisomerase n=1 Tax=Protopolystoma xenopodis TaxID=117903 RepID=A0A448WLU5_9PLAT|nr:unnamed protein product [Protopolystoma xenopodis]
MPDCRYQATRSILRVGEDFSGEMFSLTANCVIESGFTRLLTWQAIESTELPEAALCPGSKLPLAGEPTIVEGVTGPPDYMTESELITAMERHGIGTDASIPVHIENIVERTYVEVGRFHSNTS